MSTLANLTEALLRLDFDPDTALYRHRGEVLSRRQCQQAVVAMASQLAQVLEPGDRVLIALDDSPSLICLFLACIAVGAVPAVVNPRTRNEPLAALIADCQPSLVVREANAPSLGGPGAPLTLRASDRLVTFDDFALGALVGSPSPGWNAFHRQRPDAPAYLQYTSGSTGAPKGVIHTVASTFGFCQAFARDHLGLKPGDRLYSIPKLFFGYGMGNALFFPWFCGASALIDPSWPNTSRVVENLQGYRPNVLFGVPAIYASLHEHAGLLVGNVELAFSAGSPLPRAEFEFWRERGLEICDGIGATEVGHVFLANRPGSARAEVTGLPVAGYECRLTDRDGTVLRPAAGQGVLWVRGPGVSPGYWRADPLQQARFEDGWYRTGDLFEMDGTGAYRYRGREDDLFKVNGRWVVPAQVERAVCQHVPEVREAVLVPSSRRYDGLRPTLFVALDPAHGVSRLLLAQWIDQRLGGQLPSHMLPRHVHVLPDLPRNDNGKLARATLCELADTLYQQSLMEERAC